MNYTVSRLHAFFSIFSLLASINCIYKGLSLWYLHTNKCSLVKFTLCILYFSSLSLFLLSFKFCSIGILFSSIIYIYIQLYLPIYLPIYLSDLTSSHNSSLLSHLLNLPIPSNVPLFQICYIFFRSKFPIWGTKYVFGVWILTRLLWRRSHNDENRENSHAATRLGILQARTRKDSPLQPFEELPWLYLPSLKTELFLHELLLTIR
jgi:hypothetical protein